MKMDFLERIVVNSSPWNLFTKTFLYWPFLKKIDQEHKKILEIGCGVGKTTSFIAKRFPEADIVAIDFDGEQIRKARRLNNDKNVRFEQGDATQLTFGRKSFDAVFVFMAFHHIDDYKKSLLDCKRVLKPGGLLYVIDLGKISSHQIPFIPASHILSRIGFTKSVEQAGFNVMKSWQIQIRLIQYHYLNYHPIP